MTGNKPAMHPSGSRDRAVSRVPRAEQVDAILSLRFSSPAQGPTFPQSYTKDGRLRPELVDTEARDEARRWKDDGITTTQLRRFFGAVRADGRASR